METKENPTIYSFAEFKLIPAEKLLLRGEEKIGLRPKTFALLVNLVENAGSLCEKQTLLEEIWEGTVVEEGNLNRTVSELRKALGDTKGEPKLIETIPRVGYRFIAEVKTETPVGNSTPLDKTTPETKPSRFKLRQTVYPVLAITLLLSVSLIVWTFTRKNKTLTKNNNGEIQLTSDPYDENSAYWTKDGKIRYRSESKGKPSERMIMNADGSSPIMQEHEFSPDGTKILDFDETKKISYIADADGSNKKWLPIVVGNMDWSPVANEIVAQFKPEGQKDNWELGIINLDTLQLTNITNSPKFEADPSFSPDGQQIAFTSDRDGNFEIYLMNRNGTNIRRMTNNPAWESFASFSPDGTQLVFNSNRYNEKNNVYVLNLDGSDNVTPLPTGNYENFVGRGAWSPDGTRIAYSSDRNGNEDIFVIDAELVKPVSVASEEKKELLNPNVLNDSKQMIYLAQKSKGDFEIRALNLETKQAHTIYELNLESGLSISPDGKQILFQKKIDENTEICSIDSDGNNFKILSNNPAMDVGGVCSPDGQKITFMSNRGGNAGFFEIYEMDVDGGNQHKITPDGIAGTSFSPAWSANGKEIFFSNDMEDGRNGNFEIFKISADGNAEPQRITNRPRYIDESPAVSPDGKKIAFQSTQKGNSEIYIMNTDGSGQLRITRNLADDKHPAWSADGKKIYFSSNRNGKYDIYEIPVGD